MLEVMRHQDLEAQALLKAQKVAVVRTTMLCCVLPCALEGWLRRELDAHGTNLLEVLRGDGVDVTLQLPQANAAAMVARIDGAGQGKVTWLRAVAANGSGCDEA